MRSIGKRWTRSVGVRNNYRTPLPSMSQSQTEPGSEVQGIGGSGDFHGVRKVLLGEGIETGYRWDRSDGVVWRVEGDHKRPEGPRSGGPVPYPGRRCNQWVDTLKLLSRDTPFPGSERD